MFANKRKHPFTLSHKLFPFFTIVSCFKIFKQDITKATLISMKLHLIFMESQIEYNLNANRQDGVNKDLYQ